MKSAMTTTSVRTTLVTTDGVLALLRCVTITTPVLTISASLEYANIGKSDATTMIRVQLINALKVLVFLHRRTVATETSAQWICA